MQETADIRCQIFSPRSLSREAWNNESNWIGYIAVATDEGKVALGRRDIVIAWRGTIRYMEIGTGFDYPMVSADDLLGEQKDIFVHEGWLSMYTSADPVSQYNKTSVRDQIIEELKRLLDQYKDEEISLTLTGHSLGGALSTLCAADIIFHGFNKIQNENQLKICPVTVFAFACPHVGNKDFKYIFDRSEDVHVLRISNAPDAVPKLPPFGFEEIGQELKIDSRKSFYVRGGNLQTWHDLELYLHSVAGTQGLKDEYLVPGSWWCEKHKCMVQQEDGSWKLEDHQN
ncbi:alpha/beta-Hydrolases superfamily protein [Euphorbia peplus]|nr:alpha/beta-Hydrolases superfamily protein [Euphorbia peplus]